VVISTKPVTDTLAALRAAGYAPAAEAASGVTEVERAAGRRAPEPTDRFPLTGRVYGYGFDR
jgi:hypothetical protein